MRKTILGVLLLASLGLVGSQTLADDYPRRKPVSLPADAKAIFLGQMRGHMVSLDNIITALGLGRYDMAADVAASMGVARFQQAGSEGAGLGIAEHLPEEFRAISKRFRVAADAFATTARAMPAEPSAARQRALMAALAAVTNECRICHDSYRVE